MRALRRRFTLVVVAAGLVALAVLAWPAGAAGPWRAQIVDAETGQPLEGVVVLARWDEKTAGWPHPDRRFHDVDEMLSDTDGRIVIPARDLSRNNRLRAIVGPDIAMFKAGYGRWRFRADPAAARGALGARAPREARVAALRDGRRRRRATVGKNAGRAPLRTRERHAGRRRAGAEVPTHASRL